MRRMRIFGATAATLFVAGMCLTGVYAPLAQAASTCATYPSVQCSVEVKFVGTAQYGDMYGSNNEAGDITGLDGGLPWDPSAGGTVCPSSGPSCALYGTASDGSDQSGNISGLLVCSTSAEPTPTTTNTVGVYHDIHGCSGLSESDPGYTIVYDAPDSSYTITKAPLTIAVGPNRPSSGNITQNEWSGWVPCPANTGFSITTNVTGGSWTGGTQTVSESNPQAPATGAAPYFNKEYARVSNMLLDSYNGTFPVTGTVAGTSITYSYAVPGALPTPGAGQPQDWRLTLNPGMLIGGGYNIPTEVSNGFPNDTTVFFAHATTLPPAVGQSVTVTGASSAALDGTWTVLDSSRTSVTFSTGNNPFAGVDTITDAVHANSVTDAAHAAAVTDTAHMTTDITDAGANTPNIDVTFASLGFAPAGTMTILAGPYAAGSPYTIVSSTSTSAVLDSTTEPGGPGSIGNDAAAEGFTLSSDRLSVTFSALRVAPTGSMKLTGTTDYNGTYSVVSSTTTSATLSGFDDSTGPMGSENGSFTAGNADLAVTFSALRVAPTGSMKVTGTTDYNGTYSIVSSTTTSAVLAAFNDAAGAYGAEAGSFTAGNADISVSFPAAASAPVGTMTVAGTANYNGLYSIVSSTTSTAVLAGFNDVTGPFGPETSSNAGGYNGGRIPPTGGTITFTPSNTSCTVYGGGRIALAQNQAIVSDPYLAGFFGVPYIVNLNTLASPPVCHRANGPNVLHDPNWNATNTALIGSLADVTCVGASDPNFTITYPAFGSSSALGGGQGQNIQVEPTPTATLYDGADDTPGNQAFDAPISLTTQYGSFGEPDELSATANATFSTGKGIKGQTVTCKLGFLKAVTSTVTDANGSADCFFTQAQMMRLTSGTAYTLLVKFKGSLPNYKVGTNQFIIPGTPDFIFPPQQVIID